MESPRRYYDSLYEVAAAVNSARTPEDVLLNLVENTAKALDAKGCSILLLTPDKKCLIHTAAHGLSNRYISKGLITLDPGIVNALEGKPVAVFDAILDKRTKYGEAEEQEGIKAIMSVPIMLREKAIGVIRVYKGEEYQFTEDEMRFVCLVANLGAIALENARLYDRLHENYKSLQSDILEWRATLGEDWISKEPGVVAHRWWKFV